VPSRCSTKSLSFISAASHCVIAVARLIPSFLLVGPFAASGKYRRKHPASPATISKCRSCHFPLVDFLVQDSLLISLPDRPTHCPSEDPSESSSRRFSRSIGGESGWARGQGRFPQIGVCAGGGGQRLARRECDTSLKNSKSAIKLLQVVLASAPTAKPRVFASKHAQRRHPPQ
jgi:hypothetical protein